MIIRFYKSRRSWVRFLCRLQHSLQPLRMYSLFLKSCDHLVFFCVPLTLFWLLVFVKDHHLEVSHHLFDISGEEHMAIQRQSRVWHHRPQGKVGIIKAPPMEVSERYLTASIHLLRRCLNNVSAWIWVAAVGVHGGARRESSERQIYQLFQSPHNQHTINRRGLT